MTFRWLLAFYYAYLRRVDRAILWPACKRAARDRGIDLDVARAAFATHAFNDIPWKVLGEAEIIRQVDKLQ